MTAIAQSDLTFSKVDEDFLSVANKMIIWDITFGNGVLTYPSGGVPVATSVGTLGFNKTIKFVTVQQPSTNGYIYKWTLSDTAPKIRIYQSSGDAIGNHTHTITGHTHQVAVTSAAAAGVDTWDEASALGVVFLSGATLQRTKTGAATHFDTSACGTLTTSSAGSAAADASALSELSTAATPAAITVRVMLIGE